MRAGYGMLGPLMTGCGRKLFRRERDLLILTDGMRDSFKIDGGMRDEKRKTTRYKRYANCATLTRPEAGFCD